MKLIPWKFFRTWECISCGVCCKKYIVGLSKEEALRLIKKYGKHTVILKGKRYFIRKINGTCIFQVGNLCSIQREKPLACRLWPFFISKKPLKDRDRLLAEFEYKNQVFYVYVDPFCRGLNRGKTPITKAIIEAIRIKYGEQNYQLYTTSRILTTNLSNRGIYYVSL